MTLILMSCNSEPPGDIGQEVPDSMGVDTIYLPVIVNNLRVRQEPKLSSETITMLPEKSRVKFWGDQSDETITVTLRGEEITDHWYKIRAGGTLGWIFGGGVRMPEHDNGESIFNHIIIPGKRVGPVAASDSELSLITHLGGDVVERGEFSIGEGEMVQATYLFPGTSQELVLLWENQDFENLIEVRIRKKDSKWVLENGLKVGTSLSDVVKLNGGDFLMTGFEWDYAGTSLNWQGGALPDKLTLIFEPPKNVIPELMGDQAISTGTRSLIRENPVVKTIRVFF